MVPLFSKLIQSSHLIYPGNNFRSHLKRARYCLRGIAFYPQMATWLRFLSLQGLEGPAAKYPLFYNKLQRSYLSRHLRISERLLALQHHYKFLKKKFSAESFERIFESGMPLATIPTKDCGVFVLNLGYSEISEREGELMLSLKDSSAGELIYFLAFSVRKFPRHRAEVFIGGLQGRKTAPKETIVAVTRALHGLRPKALLLFALQEMCLHWGISALRGVSNRLHIHRSCKERRKLLASYDTFWEESGGLLLTDGTYVLPSIFTPRDLESIKPNKRNQYKKRYAMMSDISNQIEQALQSFSPSNTLANISPLSEASKSRSVTPPRDRFE
jgi:uncharacterized protein